MKPKESLQDNVEQDSQTRPRERLIAFGNKVIEVMAAIPNPAIPMPPRSSNKQKI